MKIKIIIILLIFGSLGFVYILLNTFFIFEFNNKIFKKDIVLRETIINNISNINTGNILKQEEFKNQESNLDNQEEFNNIKNNEIIIKSDIIIEEDKNLSILEEFKNPNIPEKINLDVPFYSQAPDKIWVLPWKEACEESSLILAYYYVIGKTLSKEKFKEELLNIVEFEKEVFGNYVDTNIEQTANILENYFDYNKYKIIENPSIEDIKYELAQGNPIIAPFAGQMLKNPHFVGDGPRYHMLVIVGYDENNFITNDVGTYMGKNYVYSYETIINAIHDLVPNGKGDIKTGEKRILVIE